MTSSKSRSTHSIRSSREKTEVKNEGAKEVKATEPVVVSEWSNWIWGADIGCYYRGIRGLDGLSPVLFLV